MIGWRTSTRKSLSLNSQDLMRQDPCTSDQVDSDDSQHTCTVPRGEPQGENGHEVHRRMTRSVKPEPKNLLHSRGIYLIPSEPGRFLQPRTLASRQAIILGVKITFKILTVPTYLSSILIILRAMRNYSRAIRPWESNPKVFTDAARQLGLSPHLHFEDVFDSVPSRTIALVLAYPTPKEYEERKEEEENSDTTLAYAAKPLNLKDIWFKQTTQNSCGPVALAHAIFNPFRPENIG